MEHNPISSLLRKIRTVQFFSAIAQFLILGITAVLFWKLADQIERQYLWSSPWLVLITASTILLFLLSRTLASLVSQNHHVNAAHMDRLYELKERVSTYVELEKTGHPFLEPLIHETAARLENVSVFRASRIQSAMMVPALLLLFLLSAMLILPYLPVPDALIVKKQEQKRIAAKGKELEDFARALERNKTASPELKKLGQELRELGRQLQKPGVDKAEVLKKFNALQEKSKKLQGATQEKLADELKKAWQEAAKPERGGTDLTAEQKMEMEKLAKDIQNALEGKEPSSGAEREKLEGGTFSSKDLKSLKDALKKYQEQKSQNEQMRAELQQRMENARKTASSGKQSFTTDSNLSDRDIEKGKSGVEDGPGTTNKDSGPSHFDTKKKGTGKYVEDRTKSEYERLYEGQRENAGSDPLYLESQWDEDGNPQYMRVRHFGLNKDVSGKSGLTRMPAQNQEETAVRKERVPPSHRQIVKKYFEAIEE